MPPITADRRVDVEFPGGEVVEEEQRFGALHEHVVDAHRDQVDADRVVAVQDMGELELGADAVGAGYQHRLAVTAGQVEQGAETAQSGHDFLAERACDQRLDAFDDFLAGIDIDAGGAIGQGFFCRHQYPARGAARRATARMIDVRAAIRQTGQDRLNGFAPCASDPPPSCFQCLR